MPLLGNGILTDWHKHMTLDSKHREYQVDRAGELRIHFVPPIVQGMFNIKDYGTLKFPPPTPLKFTFPTPCLIATVLSLSTSKNEIIKHAQFC